MTINAGVSGAWKQMIAGWCGVGGVWKPILSIGTGSGSVWKNCFTAFTPVTHTYDPGVSGNLSGSETVPAGAMSLVITAYGPGGAGGAYGPASGGGGGGGGKAVKTVAIASSDWGSALSYDIASGSWSKISGSLAAGSIAMQANAGGNGGDGNNVVGNGGTAIGGDTNVHGSNGGDGGANYYYGGAAASGGGAAQTTSNANGNVPGGGAAGGALSGIGGVGANGRIIFAWGNTPP